jgi:hypothetical protein
MEKHEQLEKWVDRQMATAALPTDWPDPAAGRRHLDERITRGTSRPHRVTLWAVATAVVFVTVLALPATRAVAQRLWDQVVLGRIQVLLTDYEGHGAAASFLSPVLQIRPDAHPVPSLDDATRLAGFSPHLPRPEVFAVLPSYSVTGIASARLQLRRPAIRYLVARTGGSASEVPDSWNGVDLEVRVGPVIIADYDGILLLQSRPFELIKPADFDLELFYRLAFRALGMSERDASALGADLALSPALLTFMPKEERDLVHEFKTNTGTGYMIEEVYGPGKIAAMWSGSDRVYALFPATGEVSRGFVITVADSLE